MRASFFAGTLTALTFLAGAATPGYGDITVPNDTLPLRHDFVPLLGESMWIINGLGPSTIRITPVITPPTASGENWGGSLGGTAATGAGMSIGMHLQGTGELAGFERTFTVPIQFEQHNGPGRIPGQPAQSFDTDMFFMNGQIPPGDPDFDLLRITAGTNYGMPSPGHTTLTQLPEGDWAVDSFFDIEYRIDFIGQPGSQLSGMSGSTTATIRMGTPEPGTLVLLATAALGLGLGAWRTRRRRGRAIGAALAVIVLAAVTSTARAGLVTNSPDLPPDGVYLTPDEVHTTYGTDPAVLQVILDRAEHRPFTVGVERYQSGADESEVFGSSMHGVGRVTFPSMGLIDAPMTLVMNGPVCTLVRNKVGHTTGAFDTEMLSMDLTGMTPIGGVMIRESPTLPSLGHTTITDIGGGQYHIDSFFDVFTELSIGGGPWIPSDGSTRVNLVPEPGTLALLTVAVLGLGAWRTRRRTQGVRARNEVVA